MRQAHSVVRGLGLWFALGALIILAHAPTAWAQLPISKEYKYTGTGSCAASNCHGARQPAAKPGDPDDTYTIWASKDKHNKAYNTLAKKESAAIVQKMKLAKATEEPKCLGCHALKLEKEQLAPRAKYDVAEGVSCDSCHGPAEKWLDGHDKGEKGQWPHSKSVSLGMYDTKDVLKRAELCVSCHLAIDVDMIEAGHPSMIFELVTFSLNQPPHWKDVAEWFGPRAWGAGQAVALRDALQQVAARTKAKAPAARITESVVQARGHAVAIRPMAAQVATDAVKPLDDLLTALADVKDPAALEAAAGKGAEVAAGLAKKIDAAKLDKTVVLALLKGLVGDVPRATSAGLRSAEQVAMAVDTVFRSYNASVKPPEGKAIDGAIGKLFERLPLVPGEFDAKVFSADLQAVAKEIK